jgi:Flp pilus assembly protein CpaB
VSSRRTIILIVAIVLGALAAFGLYNYVSGLEDAAYDRAQRVDVWVVSTAIPRGTSAEVAMSQGFIEKRKVPQDVRPSTFIQDPDSELTGLVAVTDLPVNAIIVQGNFVAPSVAVTGIANRLEEEQLVTFTMSVDQVRGVAGMLSPGDQVNIMVAVPIEQGEEGTDEAGNPLTQQAVPSAVIAPGVGGIGGSVGGLPYANVTRMVYQKVRILAIGNQLAPDLGQQETEAAQAVSALGLVTFAVPPEAAMRLAMLDPNLIYLSLVPKSYEPVPLLPIDPTEVLPGEDAGRLTPYPQTTAPAP